MIALRRFMPRSAQAPIMRGAAASDLAAALVTKIIRGTPSARDARRGGLFGEELSLRLTGVASRPDGANLQRHRRDAAVPTTSDSGADNSSPGSPWAFFVTWTLLHSLLRAVAKIPGRRLDASRPRTALCPYPRPGFVVRRLEGPRTFDRARSTAPDNAGAGVRRSTSTNTPASGRPPGASWPARPSSGRWRRREL